MQPLTQIFNDTEVVDPTEKRVSSKQRPTEGDIAAYVREMGYDRPDPEHPEFKVVVPNTFYARHDALGWRRSDGTPVLDWKDELDIWRRGENYDARKRAEALEEAKRKRAQAEQDARNRAESPYPWDNMDPKVLEAAKANVARPVAGIDVSEKPYGWMPATELASTYARADDEMHQSIVKKTHIPLRYAARIKSGEAPLSEDFQADLSKGDGLFIVGPRGTGKTELACRLAYEYVARRLMKGVQGWTYRTYRDRKSGRCYKCDGLLFTTSADLMTELRSTFDGKSGVTEAEVIEKYATIPVLIIDDLGKDATTQWVLSKLFQIINARYENMRSTIVTTQYTQAELIGVFSSQGGREEDAKAIVSRLVEMTVKKELDGQDRRFAKRREAKEG